MESLLADLEQKYSSKDIPSCDKLTPSVLQEHTNERERVLHLIDQVAVAGEEIVIRVRQQDSDQIYTEHIERLLIQAKRRLEKFEDAWLRKQQELENFLDQSDNSAQSNPKLEKVSPFTACPLI